ncbi:MAG: chloride channel protein [Pseudomonadota bacterium]
MTRNVARILIYMRKLRRRADRIAAIKVWAFAIIIGIAAAYGVIAFRAVIDMVSVVAFGETEEMVTSGAASLGFARAWAAPIIGGIAVSVILFVAEKLNWLPEGRGQSIADVIEARAARGGRVSVRAGLAAATVSAVSLGAGASAGREGPAVHLGATIASALDRHLGFSAKHRRTLLGCGAAAAVAASFNAPIAGVLFALEVILGNYALSVFGPIAAASVTSAIVTRIHLGDFPAFDPPALGEASAIDTPLAALLGLIAGLIAAAFLVANRLTTEGVRALSARIGLSYLMLPPLGGVIIGLIGAFYPEVFGVGYEAVTNALAGKYTIAMLAILVLAKCAATAVTLSCRFGGGVFAPGLVIGAFAGAAFGASLGHLFPDATASPVYYALIGMGAAGGAILGAPISTTLIVFEMTGEYSITISLMVAVALATLVVQTIYGRSFFHWQLSRRGYDLSEGPQGVILQTIRVRDVMEKMPPGAPLSADAERLKEHHSLGRALAILDNAGEHGLPVVDPNAPETVVGYLSRVKALGAYNRALIDSNIEHHT